MADLNSKYPDFLTSLAKGVVGACPIIGPMLAEIIGMIVPNQRVARINTFLQTLEMRVRVAEEYLVRVRQHLKTSEGIDLLEEGMTQATHAVSKERQQHLAHLLGTSLTAEKLRYEESKKMFWLLHELTDPELIWLNYYSQPLALNSNFHAELTEIHPEILKPAVRTMDSSNDELDRNALQDSYKRTLQGLGLIENGNNLNLKISHLGTMLIRYISSNKNTAT
ncbi:hypothetical protein CKO09_11855 [Chromatium weissei]|nr:hypothetical protein [Chromatium weissei]